MRRWLWRRSGSEAVGESVLPPTTLNIPPPLSRQNVHEIDPSGDRANAVRKRLGEAVAVHEDLQGATLAGFALVTWDTRGAPVSSFMTDRGPIGSGLVPSYVRDVLSRHVAVELANG